MNDNDAGDTFERILQDATFRALHGSHVAVDQLQKTEQGKRLLKVFVHVQLRGRGLTAEDWLAFATLCQAAAHLAQKQDNTI